MLKRMLLWLAVPMLSACSAPSEETAAGPNGYAAEVAVLDAEITWLRARTGSSWSLGERLSETLSARAHLTGRFDDLIEAEKAIEEAFHVAGPDDGPFLARASLQASLHRLGRVEADLAAVERAVIVDDNLRSEVEGLRADVAFHSGRYEEALEGYERALRLHQGPSGLARLAHYYWKTGDMARADDLYARAEAMIHVQGSARAWFHLQRGLLDLDMGRLDDAMEHYREADRQCPGWWLIEEHMAEVLALRGERDEARARYRDVVARTSDPELMAALAELCDSDEQKLWLARAEVELDRRIALLPEAAGGHALEFFLGHGSDPSRTLAMARENHRLRPGGESSELLARALHAAGQGEQACAVVEGVFSTSYRTESLKATAAEICEDPELLEQKAWVSLREAD